MDGVTITRRQYCAWCDWNTGDLTGEEARAADLEHFFSCGVAEKGRSDALARRVGWHTYILKAD